MHTYSHILYIHTYKAGWPVPHCCASLLCAVPANEGAQLWQRFASFLIILLHTGELTVADSNSPIFLPYAPLGPRSRWWSVCVKSPLAPASPNRLLALCSRPDVWVCICECCVFVVGTTLRPQANSCGGIGLGTLPLFQESPKEIRYFMYDFIIYDIYIYTYTHTHILFKSSF